MNNYNPVQSTPFSISIKVKARFWRLVWLLFYRPTPWFLYKYRAFILNVFGASVSYKSKPSNSAFIEYPWNLNMEPYSSVGENSWIYCLDKISIGKYACVGQYTKLITGSHNYKSQEFELITKPIVIGKGAWLTCDVMVLPGVTVGNFSVIGARSLLTKNIPENCIAFGTPCEIKGVRFEKE